MNLAIKHVIEGRTSVSKYVEHTINQDRIEEMVRLASLSPSAYNLQNWKFIAVQSLDAKQKLQQVAYGQPQILSASVTFIVCGQLGAHKSLEQTLKLSVDDQIMPANIAQAWVQAATNSHQQNDALQRDEAIRSASLAAMTLMYSAQAMGYASGAMGGFDEEGVKHSFELDEADIPVMLVTVGKAGSGNWQQKTRKPVTDILFTC